MKIPVLLVAFNRPYKTQKVLEAIASYFPDELYVAVDGPREGKIGELEKVQRVRELAREGIHAKKVIPFFHEKNLGCRLGVPTAVTKFFENVDYGVILEDDCVPCQDFWDFMEFGLTYFHDDTRIGHINGNCLMSIDNPDSSFYYSHLNHVWGWGSWRRAWRTYSVSVDETETTIRNVLSSLFPMHQYIQEWWLKHISMAARGDITTWDYQWTFTLWKEGQVCVTPVQNLVVNIGFDEEATHTQDDTCPGFNLRFGSLKPPYQLPRTRTTNVQLDFKELASHYRIEKPKPEKFTKVIKRKIKNLLGIKA